MDRPNVVARISKLKSEIERLRILATDCHPAVSTEITSLADDMNSHVAVLENFLARDPGRPGQVRL